MKEQCSCPFEIRYNFIKYYKGLKRYNVFYKVEITKCVTKHISQLFSQFYNTSESTSTGKSAIRLPVIKTLFIIQKNGASIPVHDLRPLIVTFVKTDQPLDCNFMTNFRLRITYFIAMYSDCVEITQE